jgi:hypothetical protein
MYAGLPRPWPAARYLDAGSAVLADGRYADQLPCLPEEPCPTSTSGETLTQVRAADGQHFCVATVAQDGTCATWSSGAWRYGSAMAEPLIQAVARQVLAMLTGDVGTS